jgi:hypothetical protein
VDKDTRITRKLNETIEGKVPPLEGKTPPVEGDDNDDAGDEAAEKEEA